MYIRRPTPQELVEIRRELHQLFGKSQYLAGKVPNSHREIDEVRLFIIALFSVLLLMFQDDIEAWFW
jgi:hypothetical protein